MAIPWRWIFVSRRAPCDILSHEVLWPDEQADPREWSVEVAADLGDFVRSAWDLEAFPVDFWDARSNDGA